MELKSVAAAVATSTVKRIIGHMIQKAGDNKSLIYKRILFAKTSVLSSVEMLPVHKHVRLSLFKNGIDIFSIGRSRAGESGVSQHLPDDELPCANLRLAAVILNGVIRFQLPGACCAQPSIRISSRYVPLLVGLHLR